MGPNGMVRWLIGYRRYVRALEDSRARGVGIPPCKKERESTAEEKLKAR